jgi:hypothetical protein
MYEIGPVNALYNRLGNWMWGNNRYYEFSGTGEVEAAEERIREKYIKESEAAWEKARKAETDYYNDRSNIQKAVDRAEAHNMDVAINSYVTDKYSRGLVFQLR